MFKKLSVGKKIFMGFSLVIILLVTVGFVAYKALTQASNGFE